MQRPMIENPYRPGAGHVPPVIGGRDQEMDCFHAKLTQVTVTENVLITGLRGFGKTVLLEQFKHAAQASNWLWVGNDLSESSTLTEDRLCVRLLADIAEALEHAHLNDVVLDRYPSLLLADGVCARRPTHQQFFDLLRGQFEQTPGHAADKLKAAISVTLSMVAGSNYDGLVFGYDEAQCLCDHAQNDEFPMSVLVETISSLQKRDGVAPCLLVLSGLPAVFDALTATRTYTERMFQVLELNRLSREDTYHALVEPLQELSPPLFPTEDLLDKVVDLAGGYPYLIQFFGKELVDKLVANGGIVACDAFPDHDVIRRLDAGLFAARWNKTTDKQREFLGVIASRPLGSSSDFTARELVELSGGEYTSAQASQLLTAICERGLLYRSRRGCYAFTVPMSETMIQNRLRTRIEIEDSWAKSRSTQAKRPRPPAPPLPTIHDLPPLTGAMGLNGSHINGAGCEAEKSKRRSWFPS